MSKWDVVRAQYGELTGGEEVTNSVYANIQAAIDNLGNVVATGSKEAIHEAGTHFYRVLAE